MSKWTLAVDRGGTFTDILAVSPDQSIMTKKILSTSPSYTDSILEAVKIVFKDNHDVTELNLKVGTTITTNALLEQKGVKVGLLVTKGFEDLLKIGNQKREHLFQFHHNHQNVLFEEVFGVSERLTSSGEILEKINIEEVRKYLSLLKEKKINSIAICLMHSWKNNIHEKKIEKLCKKEGFQKIVVSSEQCHFIEYLERMQTTLIEAYLSPILQNYIQMLWNNQNDYFQKKNININFEFMQSNGGLKEAFVIRAINSILSGPSGGLNAMSYSSKDLGLDQVIGIDMGGTSTDISRFAGEFERKSKFSISNVEFFTDQLDIETIAAGGGSILKIEDKRFQVGPESAGSIPGPACYGLGGPLTITDANLLLGRIIPEFFPKTFGENSDQFLDKKIVKSKFEDLQLELEKLTGEKKSIQEIASGFLQVAVENISNAIKKVTTYKGFDVREHGLYCFGGASPQIACEVAENLDISKIIIHPFASIFSAYGILMADQRDRFGFSKLAMMDKTFYSSLENEIIDYLKKNRFDYQEKIIEISLDLRIKGQDEFLNINVGQVRNLKNFEYVIEKFKQEYFVRYKQDIQDQHIEVANIKLELIKKFEKSFINFSVDKKDDFKVKENLLTTLFYEGKNLEVKVIHWSSLKTNKVYKGPMIIIDGMNTLFINPRFKFKKDKKSNLILNQSVNKKKKIKKKRDSINLELFSNMFQSVCEQMGGVLSKSSHSVNIKEREDFSCALFDQKGNLIANAPHVPVHLASMGDTVKNLIYEKRDDFGENEFYLSNDPYSGGSHLPDLTLVTPIFNENQTLIAFVANRAHHADIGGITPGSMPAFSKNIHEEGVVLKNFLLSKDNTFFESNLLKIFKDKNYPVRGIPERIQDLKAQIASNMKGVESFQEILNKYDPLVVQAYMKYIMNNGEECLDDLILHLLDGNEKKSFNGKSYLDDGTKLELKIHLTSNPSKMIFDFEGTTKSNNSNLNCPLSVTRACIMYVVRCLINKDIPLNDGCIKKIEIKIPNDCILSPNYPDPVVGGNVETSQQIVDLILYSLNISANSQGTMNNFTFSGIQEDSKQYYETIAGGSGGSVFGVGESGKQVHMTNTKITDCEILELRFPDILLKRFEIRKKSGGKGKFNGGNGVTREFEFKSPFICSILSERRSSLPLGLLGGEHGKNGINILTKSSGENIEIGSRSSFQVESGDSLTIKTPGGGAYMKKEDKLS